MSVCVIVLCACVSVLCVGHICVRLHGGCELCAWPCGCVCGKEEAGEGNPCPLPWFSRLPRPRPPQQKLETLGFHEKLGGILKALSSLHAVTCSDLERWPPLQTY